MHYMTLIFEFTENASSRPTPTRRAPEALVPPPEEYVDESAYVPPPTVQSDPMPSEPLQTGPSPPPEVVGGQIPLEQMAQLLATALR